MEQILTLVLPVFGIMLAGYLVGHLKILGQESSHALNAFVYYVVMPLLLFQSVAATDITALWDPGFIAIFLVPQFLVHLFFVLGAIHLFGWGFKEALLGGMAASWGNTVYMGFPLVQTMLGEAAMAAVVIIVLVQSLFFMVGTLVILDLRKHRGGVSPLRAIGHGFLSFIKNPAMVAALIGMLIAALRMPLHPALDAFVRLMAPAAAPCALFAIGLFLTTQRLNAGIAAISVMTLVKLILSPALVIAMAYLAGFWGSSVPQTWVKAAVLLAALPTGTLVFVFAQKHRSAEELCSGTILISSIFSVVTISLLINWI